MNAPSSKVGRFVGFAVVGASGLVVNQMALWFLTSKLGVYYLLSAVLATQISTIWNFALVERFVFDGGHEGRWARLGWFALMNNIWLLVRTPFLYLLTTGAGLNYLISNAVVLGAMTLVRFGIADNLIWADRSDLRGASALRDGTRIWNYDIHGIVAITSESRLPELVRFQVPALPGPADIEVVVSNAGFGGLRRTIDVVEEGSTISYVEHLGRHGFAAKIDVDTLAHIQVSKLLRRSPHVAYTNVVEPVVRWVMVRKGYILAHAACLQIDGHGVLITARTDTGKTTTCLKSIKEQGTGFVSDDMVIIDQRAVLSQAADDLLAHAERRQGRADAPSHACVAAGAGSSALEVRPLRRDGVRQHQPACRLDERDRADDHSAAEVPGGPFDPRGGDRAVVDAGSARRDRAW
jgi:putative flippase GtrA